MATLAACGGGSESKEAGTPSSTSPTAAGPATTTTVTHTPIPGDPATDPESIREATQHFGPGWKTDFSRQAVSLDEIRSGGPPKDGIPAVDEPKFEDVAAASGWLDPREPVVSVVIEGEACAYPLQILIWHEIVNDTIGTVPVIVTFCPLCNTAIAFDRRVNGVVYDFGTTGNLRFSDMVMYDRQTETWWQQFTGEGIVGELTGVELASVPSQIVAFEAFAAAHPGGQVLSRDTGFDRDYGRNPYPGYDDVDSSPFLFSGEADERLKPLERVVTVDAGVEFVAYPYPVLRDRRVIHDIAGGEPVVIFFTPDALSALDAFQIAESDSIGSAAVFRPTADGRSLTFEPIEDGFRDQQTGSRWDIFGRAVAGPLAGTALEPVVHGNDFWFAWAAFRPDTRIFE